MAGARAKPAAAPRRAGAVAAHRDDDASELFGITELCREFGISLRTIRFYEDKGLLSRAASTARGSTRGATARGSR